MSKEDNQGKMDVDAMMDLYKKLGTPGAPHKMLSRITGSWTARTKNFVSPDKPPVESKGTCEQKMVLDGRFLQQEFTGDMMGMPFTGIGFTGYDNNTKKYVSTWMDSMSTNLLFFEGTAGPDGKTITQESDHVDPARGPMKWRSVTKIVDENTHTFEMYTITPAGKEEKMMEITYTRK
jgi:hypothetical protein